jgi:hypothetical protein
MRSYLLGNTKDSGLVRSHVLARYFRHCGNTAESHVGGVHGVQAKLDGGEKTRDLLSDKRRKQKKKFKIAEEGTDNLINTYTAFQHTLCRTTR